MLGERIQTGSIHYGLIQVESWEDHRVDQGLGWAGRVQGAQMIKGQDTSANHIPIYLFTVWVVGMDSQGYTQPMHTLSPAYCVTITSQ